MNNTQTFLPPIEKPKGLMMKVVYYFTKKQLGKVITPVKVFAARLPIAFGKMGAKVYQLDKKLVLSKEMIFLIRHQVARINVCEFCMDISRYKAMEEIMNEEKISVISEYHSSPLFNDVERSALDYVTELTKDKKVNPETFSRMAAHYSEREICEIVYLVASEHLSNITNIGLNIHSDMFCDISKKKDTGN
ncbi:MAG: carboxymuconolactone decarboxylase family protein [Niabella sp.]